ncbi:winged-helix domain-containing protein [Planctomycetota bacterium]|nr:winged-helix domain-containing protein [Planctomycetota bacterium]
MGNNRVKSGNLIDADLYKYGLPVKGQIMEQAGSVRMSVLIAGEGYLQQLTMHHLDGLGVRARYCGWEDVLGSCEQIGPTVVVLVVDANDGERLAIAKRLSVLREEHKWVCSVVVVCRAMMPSDAIQWLDVVDDIFDGESVTNRGLFLARVQARLRSRGVRVQWEMTGEKRGKDMGRSEEVCKSMRVGEIAMWPEKFEVQVGGKRVVLTLTQFRLLELLMKRPGWILTPEVIRQTLNLESGEARDSVVKNHVYMLRRKLGACAAKQVETVRGVGYRIREVGVTQDAVV